MFAFPPTHMPYPACRVHTAALCTPPLPPSPAGVPDTWDNLYSFFINRVRDRLHVVLSFSPVGKKFSRWAQQVRGWAGRCANSWWGAAGMSLV